MDKNPFMADQKMTGSPPPKRKLRIAQVAPLWTRVPPATYGGIELLVGLLTDELVRLGHDVTLFGTGDSQTTASLHPVCDRNVLDGMDAGTIANYEYYGNAAIAEALLAASRFDVIHVHVGCEHIPSGALSKTPVLFTMHTQLGVDDAWVLKKYPQVPVAAISHFQIKGFETPGRTHIPVVYNGCDFDAFNPSFDPGGYLVFLGRISHDKNPLDAIRIAKKSGMPIILAGQAQGKKEGAYFDTFIKPLINGEDVKYVGLVNHAQKNKLLRGASALLAPVQWNEPFGIVMIEAMACGTPVIAFNNGSVPEVLEDGVTGFIVENEQQAIEAVAKIHTLDRDRIRAEFDRRFTAHHMAQNYLDLYARLAAQFSPKRRGAGAAARAASTWHVEGAAGLDVVPELEGVAGIAVAPPIAGIPVVPGARSLEG